MVKKLFIFCTFFLSFNVFAQSDIFGINLFEPITTNKNAVIKDDSDPKNVLYTVTVPKNQFFKTAIVTVDNDNKPRKIVLTRKATNNDDLKLFNFILTDKLKRKYKHTLNNTTSTAQTVLTTIHSYEFKAELVYKRYDYTEDVNNTVTLTYFKHSDSGAIDNLL